MADKPLLRRGVGYRKSNDKKMDDRNIPTNCFPIFMSSMFLSFVRASIQATVLVLVYWRRIEARQLMAGKYSPAAFPFSCHQCSCLTFPA
jgi:hypothetical protein